MTAPRGILVMQSPRLSYVPFWGLPRMTAEGAISMPQTREELLRKKREWTALHKPSMPRARQFPVGREDFFWEQVDNVGGPLCWEWRGASGKGPQSPKNYGQASYDGRQYGTHTLAFMFSRGPIPDGLCVLHSCDNRWCVRPDHLFLGTKGDNYRDSSAKGRHCAGERHGMAKLTWRDVDEIRVSVESGPVLAARYGVEKGTISRVRLLKTWLP